MADKKMWSCKVGECEPGDVPPGGDQPMRLAVEIAYEKVTGKEATFLFSGWGDQLTEGERAVVEDRLPIYPAHEESWLHRANEIRMSLPFAYWLFYDAVLAPLLLWGAISLSLWFVVGLVLLAVSTFFDVIESIIKWKER